MNESIARIYAILIHRELMTKKEVPANLKKEVERILKEDASLNPAG
jgi:hypothetical protein